MPDADVVRLVDEILAALADAGEVENWAAAYLQGPQSPAVLDAACMEVTERLLGAEPPRAAEWEHLVFTLAVESAKSHGKHDLTACRAAIDTLGKMIDQGRFDPCAGEAIDTLASGLTLVLSAEIKLRQPIEFAILRLCDRYPDRLPAMAERCQSIWQRRGQMSGAEGLFVWDLRNHLWRLNQDFKPYRP